MQSVNVLAVCLGNICRSPLAEEIIRFRLSERGINAFVDSAGTSDYHAGEQPDSRAIAIALQKGLDIRHQRSRPFVPDDFDRFDFIFPMDISNRENILKLVRTEEDSLKVKLFMEIVENESVEVPDPYFGDDSGFEQVFNMLDRAALAFAEQQFERSKK